MGIQSKLSVLDTRKGVSQAAGSGPMESEVERVQRAVLSTRDPASGPPAGLVLLKTMWKGEEETENTAAQCWLACSGLTGDGGSGPAQGGAPLPRGIPFLPGET